MKGRLLLSLFAFTLAQSGALGAAPKYEQSSALSDSLEKPHRGRPRVKLDRLDFPSDVKNAAHLERHLRSVLKREARRMDWGAGRDNTIEYRFQVTELRTEHSEGVLQVHCSAVGRLPGGQSARSRLSFGGAENSSSQLTKRVLEIVARGVLTRLAELERERRGLR